MVYEWKDKVVLITGAAAGIGACVVRIIVKEGVKHIAILDVDVKSGEALRDELNSKYGPLIKFYRCDATNEEQLLGTFDAVKKEQGYIDVVVNNAGIMNDSYRLYKTAIDLNVTATVTGTLKAYELMRKDKGGRGGTVINISSVAGITQSPMLPIYFATKAAVLQFSNCIGLKEYYEKSQVRVLVICFGATDTPLSSMQKLGSFDADAEANLMNIVATYPMQPPEVAAESLVEAFKRGESGSTWLSNNSRPVHDISHLVKQAYGQYLEAVYGK